MKKIEVKKLKLVSSKSELLKSSNRKLQTSKLGAFDQHGLVNRVNPIDKTTSGHVLMTPMDHKTSS